MVGSRELAVRQLAKRRCGRLIKTRETRGSIGRGGGVGFGGLVCVLFLNNLVNLNWENPFP